MPIFLLNDSIIFPPVEGAEEGIVAIGGDLSAQRLLLAYRSGIFPWYSNDEPIIWHAPELRFILMPDELHISKSMRRTLNSQKFSVTFDADFTFVIEQCALVKRKGQEGTWITDEMKAAYLNLHRIGYAHSVEVWNGNKIVGGLYGVSIAKVFYAESMFHTEANASKVALIRLVERLCAENYHFIDAQVFTEHVATLGAKEIPRQQFMQMLQKGLEYPDGAGKW